MEVLHWGVQEWSQCESVELVERSSGEISGVYERAGDVELCCGMVGWWDGGMQDDPDADQSRSTRLEDKMSTPEKVSYM